MNLLRSIFDLIPGISTAQDSQEQFKAAQREARLRALKLHQDRVLNDLAANLEPDERRQLRQVLDDCRGLNGGTNE